MKIKFITTGGTIDKVYFDATFNVGCAIGAVQVLPPGVYIAMNGRVYAADKTKKNRAVRRFEETS